MKVDLLVTDGGAFESVLSGEVGSASDGWRCF